MDKRSANRAKSKKNARALSTRGSATHGSGVSSGRGPAWPTEGHGSAAAQRARAAQYGLNNP